MESILTDRLSSLSHPQRLGVFRLLMRRCPGSVPAGEIATVLDLKPSTASVYLSALTRVGLISQRRNGTQLLYTVNLDAARQVVSGLLFDCCGGRADLCPPQFAEFLGSLSQPAGRKMNVLFVCTGNSARSIFAEALLRDVGGDRFNAYSAGTEENAQLNPYAMAVLQSKGHEISALRPKNLSEFQNSAAPKMDFVFTVCDRAANKGYPSWPGQPVSGHWGLPDPALAVGNEAYKRRAFQDAYQSLHTCIDRFSALPFDAIGRVSIQKQIDQIGLFATISEGPHQ